MSILGILIFLVIVGVVLWLIPMPENIKKIIYVVVAIVAIVWLLQILGFLSGVHLS
jgi:hypothetical protein